jgi:hypothetical protein
MSCFAGLHQEYYDHWETSWGFNNLGHMRCQIISNRGSASGRVGDAIREGYGGCKGFTSSNVNFINISS